MPAHGASRRGLVAQLRFVSCCGSRPVTGPEPGCGRHLLHLGYAQRNAPAFGKRFSRGPVVLGSPLQAGGAAGAPALLGTRRRKHTARCSCTAIPPSCTHSCCLLPSACLQRASLLPGSSQHGWALRRSLLKVMLVTVAQVSRQACSLMQNIHRCI